jgi:hypothetical protein
MPRVGRGRRSWFSPRSRAKTHSRTVCARGARKIHEVYCRTCTRRGTHRIGCAPAAGARSATGSRVEPGRLDAGRSAATANSSVAFGRRARLEANPRRGDDPEGPWNGEGDVLSPQVSRGRLESARERDARTARPLLRETRAAGPDLASLPLGHDLTQRGSGHRPNRICPTEPRETGTSPCQSPGASGESRMTFASKAARRSVSVEKSTKPRLTGFSRFETACSKRTSPKMWSPAARELQPSRHRPATWLGHLASISQIFLK